MSIIRWRPALRVLSALLQPARIIPWSLRHALLKTLLLVESRLGSPRASLEHLFALCDDLEWMIAERATAYGEGINPKHRLTRYHDFFIDRIAPKTRVLDIGCGIGKLARSVAERVAGVEVVAIDSNPDILRQAEAVPVPSNLKFIEADASKTLPPGPWDVVLLSNVLEHIENRDAFLKALCAQTRPSRLLIRIPLFERHWHMPLRREFEVNYFSDPTHHIEPTLAEFDVEMAQAGLRIVERHTLWGEIWALVVPAA